MPLLLCTTLHGALTTDGCYTQRVLLRQNQCVRTTASVPLAQKTRPRLASWAAHFRLPASGLSPWWLGDSWVGARWPTVSLVLPSVLGVPSPQCLLEVPSPRTPVPAPPGVTSLAQSTCPALSWFQRAAVLCFLHPPGRLSGQSLVSLHREEGLPAGPRMPVCPRLFQAHPLGPALEIWRRGAAWPSLPGLRFLRPGTNHRDLPAPPCPSQGVCTVPASVG